MKLRFSAWVAAMSAWMWTLVAEAQTLGSGSAPAFEDTMDRGLIPLFFFVAGGIAVMTIATLAATLVLRRTVPRHLRGA